MASLPEWRGLFNWSMKYQDGTTPTDFTGVDFSAEKMAWMETVMKEYVVDFAKRMEEIQVKLKTAGQSEEALTEAGLEESEKLLEELKDVVESIDFARDLHRIGGLPTLLSLMSGPHPTLAWRAADVASTCCQNHLEVQQWFHDGGALPVLTQLLTNENATVRAKGLLAISSLVHGYPPALQEFLTKLHGLPLVVGMAGETVPRNQRKALELIKYFCQSVPGVRVLLTQQTTLPTVLRDLLGGDDNFMMGSSLGVLAELVDDRDALQLLQGWEGLVPAVERLRARLAALRGEDADALREELEAATLVSSAFDVPV